MNRLERLLKIMNIVKRDGNITQFDKDKIVKAILAAFNDVDGEIDNYAINISKSIAEKIEKLNKEQLRVEDIQNIVEEELMSSNRKDVARAYVRYRYDREKERQRKSSLIKEISSKLFAIDVSNQNANVDEKSFGGRIGEATDAMMKDYALNYCVSEMSRENHIMNRIYLHDLSHYAVGDHNCLSIPFDKLLANGFKTRQVDIRPANSINTAMQLVAVIFQLQSLVQFGGVSATHLDWTMVPYVRKSFVKHWLVGMEYLEEQSMHPDKEYLSSLPIDNEVFKQSKKAYKYAMDQTTKELKQSVEALFHNLNSLQSRSGNQLPFSSINYGTCTSVEGRMVCRALIQGSINGVGRFHSTSIFPCCIFQVMSGVNKEKGTQNYDLFRLALQSTAQRLYPNYANCDWSGNEGYDKNDPKTYFSTMGCRTANGWDINGFGQLKDGRGNICPVTIILPTIAMETYEEWNSIDGEYEITSDMTIVDLFMKRLDEKIYDAKDMLLERFEWICSQSADSAKFMYENGTMEGYVPEEGIRSALKHGTLALGQLGLAECLQILIGCDHTEPRGMELAKQIESLFKTRCTEFKEEYKLNFGVYYTPSENLSHTALKKFRERFGIIENVSDKEFFTNSMHVPVWKKMTAVDKIDIESQLTGYSSAGCITYIELPGSVKNNIDALETLVVYAMDKDIPYFAINVPNDMCNDCGYTDDIGDNCPECGSTEIRRLRRVTGYLTGDYKTAFNKGKQQEVEMRVKHM